MFGPNLSDLGHLHQPMFVIEPAPQVRRGWRAFKCIVCGLRFATPCEKHDAVDHTTCPRCLRDLTPIRSWPDAELKCDEFGNLVNGGL